MFSKQIQEQIKLSIAMGVLKRGDLLPPIREVEKQTGINRGQIHRAYLDPFSCSFRIMPLQALWPAFSENDQKGMLFDATPSARPLPNLDNVKVFDAYITLLKGEKKSRSISDLQLL